MSTPSTLLARPQPRARRWALGEARGPLTPARRSFAGRDTTGPRVSFRCGPSLARAARSPIIDDCCYARIGAVWAYGPPVVRSGVSAGLNGCCLRRRGTEAALMNAL
jgi:hypothetical protein